MTNQTREEAIFLAAMEKPTLQERVAYVEGACGGDEQLAHRVGELLKSHEESQGPLDAPPPGIGATRDRSSITEEPGTQIGPYKLLEEIGEGGFGVVYMAEQTEPVRRRVALKIIKPGMDSRQIIARFEAERQALAMMDHQNIARVLDAGTTQSSRPYFVMELVKGVPITQYCDANKLTVRERLELFIPVCQAIQHAHQKGIIHRDIKPSNVLVCLYDGKPVSKVIDFGVAKAIEQRLTEKTMFTQHGQVIGTLEYMSPEQAELSQLDIDIRSDIYSLGVMLYELLTGTTPITKERLRTAGFAEMLCIIRDLEPEKPSTRLSQSQKTLPVISAQRRIEPARLGALIQGDLDWIVMKTLEKDRTRRYESANGLARDIQRYLVDEAVEARPPSVAYRFRKFARRNRRFIAAAGTIAAALVVGLVVSLWQAARAMHAERAALEQRQLAVQERDRARKAEDVAEQRRAEAEAEKQRAEQQQAIAQAMSNFFGNDLLGQGEIANRARGERGLGAGPGFPEVVERAARNLEGRFTDQPLLEAAMRLPIGDVYRMLRKHDEARKHIERAVKLRTDALGADNPATLDARWQLAELYHDEGKYEQAEQLLKEVLQAYSAQKGKDDPGTLTTKNSLALLYHDQGNFDRAEPLYREALETAKAKLGEDHTLTLILKSNLAGLYREQKKYDQAEPLYEQVLKVRASRLGLDHPDTRASAENMAFVFRLRGKQEQADELISKLAGARAAQPFMGPINAAVPDDKSVVFIIPTNEESDSTEKKIRDYVQAVKKEIFSDQTPVITDKEALDRDLSSSALLVYGTPAGNLWLAKHFPDLVAKMEAGSRLVALDNEQAKELRFTTTWPHPQNRNRGMIVYTAQRAADVVGMNAIFHGPTDYVIARGAVTLRSGNYIKSGDAWTLVPSGQPAVEK
jgi:serine/threonine protein kinase/predicted negative regulator of RcsB-dependent stress response